MKRFAQLAEFCHDVYGRRCAQAGKSILLNGRCQDIVHDLAEEFGQFAGCWINDPPYGTTLNDWDKVIPEDEYWYMAERATVPTAPLIVFGSQPFTSAMVMSADAWHRYCLVWDKNKCGSPGLAKHRPMKTHEDLMVFSRKVHRYYPQMEKGDPYYRASVGRNGPNNHKYGFKGHGEIVNTGTRYPKSILYFPRNFSAQQQIHPTQKPTTLLEWLLKSYTSKGDLTLDITAGSASLAAAAFAVGRWCLCIERDPAYFKVGTAWLTALARGKIWDPAAYRKQYMESI